MKKIATKYGLLLGLLLLLAGCADQSSTPVTLTLWHVYGGKTEASMGAMVDKFNQTVGREKGIIINITSITNTGDAHLGLIAAAHKQPGAGELPDLFIVYPQTALAIGPERLVDWRDYFSEKELAEFVPAFVAEGEINGRLVILPTAKSSNALFINATIFDQFSRETGVKYEDLATWEGMFKAARRYYQWSGGKAFFKYDNWLHYSLINTISLGGDFFKNEKINFEDSAFRLVWGKLAASAVSGEVCLLNGYAMTAMMTGEVLCGVESTASILYFPDKVTFPDNTSIDLRLKILPVPYFKDGEPLAIQRGGGLGLVKSTKEKELAAAVFAKWFTAVDNNLPFAVEHGYFPVKTTAYEEFLNKDDYSHDSEKHRELFNAIKRIHAECRFYLPEMFEGYVTLEKNFSDAQTELFKKYRKLSEDSSLPTDSFIKELTVEFKSSLN